MNPNHKLTRITGCLFLLPLVTYGFGNGLIAFVVENPHCLSLSFQKTNYRLSVEQCSCLQILSPLLLLEYFFFLS